MTALGAAGVTAAVALGTGGCGAEIPAQLAAAPASGVAGRVGPIAIRNLFVLGSGPDGVLAAGASAPVYLNMVDSPARTETDNSVGDVERRTGGDTLVAVASPQATSGRLIGGPIQVPDGVNVKVGPDAKIVLDGLRRPLSPADMVEVTLRFTTAGWRTFRVPVLPQNTFWESYSPAPAAG
ncbi:hypothetical protein J4573_22200 [Actinomadura barringtoniae]|uniref:Copper chaperone PCu(A)C n=1 Tax=Actinomadura barringtoniae TaxID=1427535 RepID=A0A939TB64_9ACTN|nr:hypothetical protein [Actinomadura barringtoniae]MBO2449830.1 hypothetical protein [Actinomadura barringtoniae]